MTKYSSSAQRLIDLLSEGDIQQIQKDNPFRLERNDKISELCRRGAKHVVLAELSGLSGASVGKIHADSLPYKPATQAEGD